MPLISLQNANQSELRLCSVDYISSTIEKTVDATISKSKKGKRRAAVEDKLDQEKESLFKKFKSYKKAPTGTLTDAVAVAEKQLEQDKYLHLFRQDLGNKTPFAIWEDEYKSKFETTWDLAVTKSKTPKVVDSTSQNPDSTPQNNPGSSGNMSSSTSDPEPESSDDTGYGGIEYRTCSVTLKAVLREELVDHQDTIESLLTESQNTVTDVVSELQVVMHKALFAVSLTSEDLLSTVLQPYNPCA